LFSNLQAGIYPQIIVKDLGSPENCLSNLAGATIFQPNPMFVAIVPNDTTLQLQETVELSLNVDSSQGYDINSITSILWFPTEGLNCSDCINPTVLTYNDFNTYEATIFYDGVNGAQCSTTASTLIKVENNLKFFIPNAFTPNGDGTNDFLLVYGESLKNINLQIYNRWGEKIFQSKNQYDGWDGTFKGNVVAPGVYTYFFEGEYLDGKKIAQKGSVSVLR
jgi:gliding motility-associated-like protein